jgi:hypothetical protein
MQGIDLGVHNNFYIQFNAPENAMSTSEADTLGVDSRLVQTVDNCLLNDEPYNWRDLETDLNLDAVDLNRYIDKSQQDGYDDDRQTNDGK